MDVGTDVKMEVFTHGWSIISAGTIWRHSICNTTSTRAAPAKKNVQAKRIVLSFQPVVQTIAHTETQDPYMKRCNHFVILCGRASRTFDDEVHTMQVHKDLATSAGKARRTLCQQACPTNDWAHSVRQVQKRLPRRSDTHKKFMSMLKVMRVLPTVELFSVLWACFLLLCFLPLVLSRLGRLLGQDVHLRHGTNTSVSTMWNCLLRPCAKSDLGSLAAFQTRHRDLSL